MIFFSFAHCWLHPATSMSRYLALITYHYPLLNSDNFRPKNGIWYRGRGLPPLNLLFQNLLLQSILFYPLPCPGEDYKLCTIYSQNCLLFLRNIFLIKREWKQIKIIYHLTACNKNNIVSLLWYSYTDTQFESHDKETSEKSKLKDTLHNNWSVIFKSVKVIKVKGSFFYNTKNMYGPLSKPE